MIRPCSQHGRLYLGSRPELEWSIADPTDEASIEAYGNLRGQVFPCTGSPGEPSPETLTVSRAELQRLLSLAEAWLHLGTYELGIGVVGRQLREVRAALRAMGRAT